MTASDIQLPVRDGFVAAIDFGGSGQGVLLVHGSGHNAAVWGDVAAQLVGRCHPVAVDLRGHGRTGLTSSEPEQYWRDLGDVVQALSWQCPVLVGHSTGGYAVAAAVASGLVAPAAVCVVDGMVLDDRNGSLAHHRAQRTQEAAGQLRTTFRYGWRADEPQMRAHIQRCVREAPTDWLNAGARLELVANVVRRSFARQGRGWLRRPTIEEISAVTAVDPAATVFPSVDVYRRISCPLTIVLASDGFYAARRDEVRAVADAAPGRRLIELFANHNVPMTCPTELAAVVLDVAAASVSGGGDD